MCLETGFLRFGGLVSEEMNNFCGLGSIGDGKKGESFPSEKDKYDFKKYFRAHSETLLLYINYAWLVIIWNERVMCNKG